MKIEVWSDFACPASYVGRELLKTAINCFGKDKHIEIEYRSYQIDPAQSINMTERTMDVLYRKSNLSKIECQALEKEAVQNAVDIGLNVDLLGTLYTNTMHAHRLTKYAKKLGKESQMMNAIYHTYFFERKNIGKQDVLHTLAMEMGFDEAEIDMLLSFNKYENIVKEDREVAEEMGIDSVPFIIFNNMYALSGAQPLSMYMEILKDILKEDPNCYKMKRKVEGTSSCIGDECDRK